MRGAFNIPTEIYRQARETYPGVEVDEVANLGGPWESDLRVTFTIQGVGGEFETHGKSVGEVLGNIGSVYKEHRV